MNDIFLGILLLAAIGLIVIGMQAYEEDDWDEGDE